MTSIWSFALILSFALSRAATQRDAWLALGNDSSARVLPTAPRPAFWLRPGAVLLRSRAASQCGSSRLQLRLGLWSAEALVRAERALLAQGRCRENESCRVLPLPAARVGLRDPAGRWRTAAPWTRVAGPLPATVDFVLLRTRPNATTANCSGLDTRRLTAGELADLTRLVLVVQGPSPPRTLSFSVDDIQSAAKRLKLRLSRVRHNIIDLTSLRRLASSLLRARKKRLEAKHRRQILKINSHLVEALQTALTEDKVKYKPFFSPFLAQQRQPDIGETTIFIKNSSVMIALTDAVVAQRQAYGKLQIPVVVPGVGRKDSSPEDPDAGLRSSLEVSRLVNKDLRQEIELLKKVVRLQESASEKRLTELLNAAMKDFKNRSSASEKEVTQLKTRSSALEKLVNELQKTNNRSHATDTKNKMQETINQIVSKRLNISRGQLEYPSLTPIDDCGDVTLRGLNAGVFLLSATDLPVLCSQQGELVALKRSSGNLSFDRNISEYENGFWDFATGDFWVGLRYLAAYTKHGDACMKIRMDPLRPDVANFEAKYSSFQVTDGADGYRLMYGTFSGNASVDALATSQGMRFSARDKDADAFPGSCAKIFRGGGWFKSCYDAHLFGPLRPAGGTRGRQATKNGAVGMCWRGLRGGNKCHALGRLEMRLRRVSDGPAKKRLVVSIIGGCNTAPGCLSRLRIVPISETALYTITLGGAGGGQGYWKGHGYMPGGRGAIVRVTALLTKGTQLAVVAGCGGRSGSGSDYGSRGGNATILADRSRGILLAIAGGGGGASDVFPGVHGRAGEAATDAWDPICGRTPTAGRILRTHFPDSYGGLGWPDVKTRVLHGSARVVVGTGGTRAGSYGGGGGGGYNGGGSMLSRGGGGGGSFCNDTLARICAMEEGGNFNSQGFVLVHKHLCP